MKQVLDPNRKGSSGEKLVLYKLSKVLNNRFYFSDFVMLGELFAVCPIIYVMLSYRLFNVFNNYIYI